MAQTPFSKTRQEYFHYTVYSHPQQEVQVAPQLGLPNPNVNPNRPLTCSSRSHHSSVCTMSAANTSCSSMARMASKPAAASALAEYSL